MKRTLTMITAFIFAATMALPAFAQVGAGIAGNANVGKQTMQAGANADVNNSDAERAEPAAPMGSRTAEQMHHRTRSSSPSVESRESNRSGATGANAGVGANVGGTGASAGASGGLDRNSPTGGY